MVISRRSRVILAVAGIVGLAAAVGLESVWGQGARRRHPIVGGMVEGDTALPAEFSKAIEFPTDPRRKKMIEAVQDYISVEQWEEAATTLQVLLDAPDDVLIEVVRRSEDQKEVKVRVSVRKEAERLLGTLPPKGLEHYQMRSGQKAKALLAQAIEESDPQKLALASNRYLYTEAGAEATNLLATYYLDRGSHVTAALCFERLLQREKPEKLPPITLFKAALAFRRAGDKMNEEKIWKHLTAQAPNGVPIGKRIVSLADLSKHLDDQAAAAPFGLYDWPMFRGNAMRSAEGRGGAPFLEESWKSPSFKQDQARDLVMQGVRRLEELGQPILPAFFPIALTVQKKDTDKPVPLIVSRSYWGIHAINGRTGKLEWEMSSPSSTSLEHIVGHLTISSKHPVGPALIHPYQSIERYSVFFENSVLGTLSTDNNCVYLIDDLAVAPFYMHRVPDPWGGIAPMPEEGASLGDKTLTEYARHNRLTAIDLASGKLRWVLGRASKPGTDASKPGQKKLADELEDSFFLGPPLPLGGRLYVLNEKKQDLRLVCIDPRKGPTKPEVSWIQNLASTQHPLTSDPMRRMQAATLAYGEGILVCPTNAGAVLGVDLLSQSLVWAHAYRDQGQPAAVDPRPWRGRPGVVPAQPVPGMGGIMVQNSLSPTTFWKVSAPVIQEGKVVITPPDAKGIHCLNLRDGTLLWKVNKAEDDLYLAGVINGKVLIVGKKSCRALSLKDGVQVWTVDTGLPSGQGVASDNVYYLPLKAAVKSKEPEVCAIDVNTGFILAHTKSRKKADGKMVVPGNLLFYEGLVMSQTVDEVAAYPQLKTILAESDDRIKKNPGDPVGLATRGELRLDKGDIQGAIDDLRQALAAQLPADRVAKVRGKLFESMTELLQRNFGTGEKYLEEYRRLCQVEITPEMTDTERRQAEDEQQRRLANCLCLIAKGREQQGRLVDAFDAYQQFVALVAKQELISVLDEPTVKAPPDVWARHRIEAMIARATPEKLKPLEARITQELSTIRQGEELDKLRQFVATFGANITAGREARFLLAEKLMHVKDPSALLEAEKCLLEVRLRAEEPLWVGRAVEALARLWASKGLVEDEAYCYRLLGREFAHVVIRDGKTGEDFYNEKATDKRFLYRLDEPSPLWQDQQIRGERHNMASPIQHLYCLDVEGEPLPFFQNNRFALNIIAHDFLMTDRANRQVRWKKHLTPTPFAQFCQMGGPNFSPRFSCRAVGHLVVVPLGHRVFGIDPVGQRVLWERSLLGSSGELQHTNMIADQRDNTLLVFYPNGWMLKLGQSLPCDPSYVCLQTRDGLVAVEPTTGRTLWTRSDITGRSQVFGDSDYIFVVEMSPGNTIPNGIQQPGEPATTRVLRAGDGVTVKAPDFTSLYQKRTAILGRQLLVVDKEAGQQVLRLYDILTGQNLWKHSVSTSAVILKSDDPRLAGVVEQNGKTTLFDLRTHKVVLETQVQGKDLEKVQDIYLVQDRWHYYLLFNRPVNQRENPFGGPYANLAPESGLRWLPVNGAVYALDRENGSVRWKLSEDDVKMQTLVMEQFHDLPIMLFTSRNQALIQRGPGRVARVHAEQISVISYSKQTGKLKLRQTELPNARPFHAMNVDLAGGQIDLVSINVKISHTLQGPGRAEPKSAAPQNMAPPLVPGGRMPRPAQIGAGVPR